jgi:DNA-binding NtrC family response regulator
METIHVLVIEDNPDDFFLLKEALEDADDILFDIFHSDHFENALSVGEKNAVDVAIIDLQLPDSVGIDTFLSFHRQFPYVPAVIMTGNRDKDLAVKAVQAGAQDYLFKAELSPAAIVRTIRHAIERQRLMTDLQKTQTALEKSLASVRQLSGLLPICSHCKKIRDDKGYWNQVEAYIQEKSEARFSHGICQECAKKYYPDIDIYGDKE